MTPTRVPLRLPAGLSLGDTTMAAAGAVHDGLNIRFVTHDPKVGPRPETIGGWERLTTTAINGVCRNAFPWSDNAGGLNIAFGTHTHLELWTGGMVYNITPSGLAAGLVDGTGGAGFGTGAWDTGEYSEPSTTDYFPRTWSFGAYGESLMASPRGGTVYWWQNNTAVVAAALTNAPAEVSYMLMTPQLQVMALGCNEEVSGTFNPMCIRHSGVRNPTGWTSSPTTTSREYILQGGGRLVAGVMAGEYAIIWSDSALYLGTFVGAPEQIWRFDRVAVNCGLMGPNAFAIQGQRVFWISPTGQYFVYGLGGAPEPIECSLGDELFENLATVQWDKVAATSLSATSEIWFSYPDARDGTECSRIVTLNTSNGSWSKIGLARSALVDAQPAQYPVGVSPTGSAYWHERGRTDDGAAIPWFYETADQFLGEGGDQVMQIQGFKPDFLNQVGAVQLTIYTRMEPQAEERTSGPYTLDPTSTKADFRTSGRIARVRIEGNSGPTNWRLGAPQFVVQGRGRR